MSNNVEQIHRTIYIGLPDAIDLSFLYPVPAIDKVKFAISADDPSEVLVRLYDLTGRMFYKSDQYLKMGYNFFEIDVSHIAPGTYYLAVYSKTGKYYVSKQLLVAKK